MCHLNKAAALAPIQPDARDGPGLKAASSRYVAWAVHQLPYGARLGRREPLLLSLQNPRVLPHRLFSGSLRCLLLLQSGKEVRRMTPCPLSQVAGRGQASEADANLWGRFTMEGMPWGLPVLGAPGHCWWSQFSGSHPGEGKQPSGVSRRGPCESLYQERGARPPLPPSPPSPTGGLWEAWS